MSDFKPKLIRSVPDELHDDVQAYMTARNIKSYARALTELAIFGYKRWQEDGVTAAEHDLIATIDGWGGERSNSDNN